MHNDVINLSLLVYILELRQVVDNKMPYKYRFEAKDKAKTFRTCLAKGSIDLARKAGS